MKTPGLRSRQLEERRERLVRAARALLSEQGGDGFSMLQLAERAGFSPSTPYNLFGTKANVLSAVYAAEVAGFHRTIDEVRWADPVARVLGTADLLSTEFCRRADFYRNLSANLSMLALEDVRPAILQLNGNMLKPLIEALAAEKAFERWISPQFLTGHLTRLLEAVLSHWSSREWSSERFVVELRFGFGMAVLGALRTNVRGEMRRALRAMTTELKRLQSEVPLRPVAVAVAVADNRPMIAP